MGDCKAPDCPGADVCRANGAYDADCEVGDHTDPPPKPPRGRPVYKIYIVGGFAFVPHPVARGFWLRCDLSVAKVACEMCGSTIGEPCKRMRFQGMAKVMEPVGYTSGTHYVRRRAARRTSLPENVDELIFTVRR